MRRAGASCCAGAARAWPRSPNWSGGAEVKVADRATAEKLTNTRLYVDRAQLPEPEEDEFYLADLIGLAALDARRGAAGHGQRGARLRRRCKPGDRAEGRRHRCWCRSPAPACRRSMSPRPARRRSAGGGSFAASPSPNRPRKSQSRQPADRHDLARLRADAVPGDVPRPAGAFACRPRAAVGHLVAARPSTSATSPPTAIARWTTRRSAAAPAWCCGPTWWTPPLPRSPTTGRWCS